MRRRPRAATSAPPSLKHALGSLGKQKGREGALEESGSIPSLRMCGCCFPFLRETASRSFSFAYPPIDRRAIHRHVSPPRIGEALSDKHATTGAILTRTASAPTTETSTTMPAHDSGSAAKPANEVAPTRLCKGRLLARCNGGLLLSPALSSSPAPPFVPVEGGRHTSQKLRQNPDSSIMP